MYRSAFLIAVVGVLAGCAGHYPQGGQYYRSHYDGHPQRHYHAPVQRPILVQPAPRPRPQMHMQTRPGAPAPVMHRPAPRPMQNMGRPQAQTRQHGNPVRLSPERGPEYRRPEARPAERARPEPVRGHEGRRPPSSAQHPARPSLQRAEQRSLLDRSVPRAAPAERHRDGGRRER